MKKCRLCKRTLDVCWFKGTGQTKDGLTHYCIDCLVKRRNIKRTRKYKQKRVYVQVDEMATADTERYLKLCQENLPCKKVFCKYEAKIFMLPDFTKPIFKKEFCEVMINKWIVWFKRNRK